MDNWLLFVLAVFATYRLARMLAIEEGPLGIFDRVRGRIDPEQKTWLGRGINCPLCIGFWVALAVTLGLVPAGTWSQLVLNWLGIAGGMAIIHLSLER